MKIYSLEEAKQTILKRKGLHQMDYSPLTLQRTEEFFGEGVKPAQAVEIILRSVEEEGDQAIRKWSKKLDRFDGNEIKIPKSELKSAWEQLDPNLQDAMQTAASRIRAFHQRQSIKTWISEDLGGKLGQRITPIERIGVYVPGGTAPLPSSLLMSVIPAQVAGVKNIDIATPPKPAPSILAAAYLCDVNQIYQIGGAQAMAAFAFGTETVARVDKIVGAGNLFVTLAKQQLYGVVGLDGLAGPTETMIIADHTANPSWVAADLLAQAEHDVQASAILLTTDPHLAQAVAEEVDRQIEPLGRKEMIIASIKNAGGIVLVDTLDGAAELANAYGAEHLCLSVDDPELLMGKINNAGGFFLGDHSFEVLGDYVAGPSHVMPTGGTARFASPLNVLDFVKISSVIGLDPQTATQLSKTAGDLADLENLTAHAAAARARLEKK
ncbi:MAG: histidinol dehydrogenase [Anaerolineales bacterium]|nr:histidinol dehydrogenase [Anaerolineales bacterium]